MLRWSIRKSQNDKSEEAAHLLDKEKHLNDAMLGFMDRTQKRLDAQDERARRAGGKGGVPNSRSILRSKMRTARSPT